MQAERWMSRTWSTNPWAASPPDTLSRYRHCGGGCGWRGGGLVVTGRERKPRPGTDNAELSGLRRRVGGISQIRTDHKTLDAIQFCRAVIRTLITCHPSIRLPPAAVSPAINPLVTNRAPCQSPFSLAFPLLTCVCTGPSAVCSREEVKKGLSKSESNWKDCPASERDPTGRSSLGETIFVIGWCAVQGCLVIYSRQFQS